MNRNELVLLANSVGIDPTTYANDSKLEQRVLFELKRATTFSGTLATGTLTSDATAPDDGETVTIGTAEQGGMTYTFKTTLGTTANQVLIGASAAVALDNLKSAINGTGTPGTDYTANTPVHPLVTATTNTDTTQVVEARSYTITNADVATTETSGHLSWGAATLAGGVKKQVALNTTTYSGSAGISGDKNV